MNIHISFTFYYTFFTTICEAYITTFLFFSFTCYKNIQRTNIRVPYRSFYVIFIASFTPYIHTTLSTISQLPLPVDQVTLPILLSLIGKHSKYKGPHSLLFSTPMLSFTVPFTSHIPFNFLFVFHPRHHELRQSTNMAYPSFT